jgi:hypothetical protein
MSDEFQSIACIYVPRPRRISLRPSGQQRGAVYDDLYASRSHATLSTFAFFCTTLATLSTLRRPDVDKAAVFRTL